MAAEILEPLLVLSQDLHCFHLFKALQTDVREHIGKVLDIFEQQSQAHGRDN